MARTAKKIEFSPAGVQYMGMSGITQPCIDALARLISYDDHIERATVLSCEKSHALLLHLDEPAWVIVKNGFSSGYRGEGPRGLSYVLQLLQTHGVQIEEVDVPKDLFDRAKSCLLSSVDLDAIEALENIRPQRWHEYIWKEHEDAAKQNLLWKQFRSVIPYSIIDPRLMDLALTFWENEDHALTTAYRRLEDILRERTGLEEHGADLFTAAFQPKVAKLGWPGVPPREQAARANFFVSTFGVFRNPRGHREQSKRPGTNVLAEFLMCNQLFLLEGAAHPIAMTAEPH